MFGKNTDEILFESERRALSDPDAITVAVSLYNYELFIEECLNSVSAQTHGPVELIVVDDASSADASAERCRLWLNRNAERFDRATLIRHRRNRGLAAARNTAFTFARTDYVFVLDADNKIYPRALERLHEAVTTTPAEASYSQIAVFGNRTGIGYADVWSKARIRAGNYIDAMALVKRSVWQEVGGYTHLDGGWEDFDFWCKLMDRGIMAIFVPEILCRYRIHDSSMLRTSTNVATEQLKVEMTIRYPWLDLV